MFEGEARLQEEGSEVFPAPGNGLQDQEGGRSSGQGPACRGLTPLCVHTASFLLLCTEGPSASFRRGGRVARSIGC